MKRKNQGKNQPSHLPIIVRRRPGQENAAIMQIGSLRLLCSLGKKGISAFKREGDGATPLGSLAVLSGFCKRRIPNLGQGCVPLRVSRAQDGWCDAKGDANYNRPVRLPYPASAETMCRDDVLYDIGFVLDWNIRPRCQGRGSAIFLHLAKVQALKKMSSTQGCLALHHRDMARLLPHLKVGQRIFVKR